MRLAVRAVCVPLLIVAMGCQTTGGSGSGTGSTKHGTLFLKVFNENPAQTGPTDIKLLLDGQEIMNRNYMMDERSQDGQYQIKLPRGRHRLEATNLANSSFVSKSFNLKDEAFLQVYVTEDSKWRLTPSSKRSLARLVIKRMREVRGVNANPAIWMIIPAPQPATATRSQSRAKTRPAGSVFTPSAGKPQQGNR